LTKEEYLFRLGDFKESGKFATPMQLPLQAASGRRYLVAGRHAEAATNPTQI